MMGNFLLVTEIIKAELTPPAWIRKKEKEAAGNGKDRRRGDGLINPSPGAGSARRDAGIYGGADAAAEQVKWKAYGKLAVCARLVFHRSVLSFSRAMGIMGPALMLLLLLIPVSLFAFISFLSADAALALPFDGGGGWAVSSPYGGRVDPVSGEPGGFHHGVDFVISGRHADIFAAAPGVVVVANTEPNNGFGNWVRIRHELEDGLVLYTIYAHLHEVFVAVGDLAVPLLPIGREGGEPGVDNNPGYSTGEHLHFAVQTEDGTYLDPALFLADLSGW